MRGSCALELEVLRQQILASELLPPPYEQFRPILADGLCFFLERLSPARLGHIFAEQSQLPLSASPAKRLVALLHHVPTLHKLGQVLARDRRLDPQFRCQLQRLESLEAQTPMATLVSLLDGEFPGWKRAGIKLGSQALAEGSVAVVMPFVWERAHANMPHRGVFKLLKPGIDKRLDEELSIWAALGAFLDQQCGHYHLPSLDYAETFQTVSDLLVHEVRLATEQRHLAEAAQAYGDVAAIPALLPFSTARMTAMEYLDGDLLAGRLAQDAPSVSHLGPMIAEALFARPLFSSGSSALFHADPHAGNLMAMRNGRLGILDWSLAGQLQKQDRINVLQLILGAITLDTVRMRRALDELAQNRPAKSAVQEVLDRSLHELRWGSSPGVRWLTSLLDSLVTQARTRFSADLLLFRKSVLTLQGVLADVTGSSEEAGTRLLDNAVASVMLRRFVTEWPERFRQPFDLRTFDTHLSTEDLLSLLWSPPATVARYWTATWLDWSRLLLRQ